mgnify:CR=1 FL=1
MSRILETLCMLETSLTHIDSCIPLHSSVFIKNVKNVRNVRNIIEVFGGNSVRNLANSVSQVTAPQC